jgi:hypothetical protein
LLWINQVYYWRYKSKTHAHKIYLQRQLKWKLYTKVIQTPRRVAWEQRPSSLIKVEGSESILRESTCGLYYKCFTIITYYGNDSEQYYQTTITIVIDNPS